MLLRLAWKDLICPIKHLQVIAANIVIIILSAHIFFKPYKKTLQNVTEAVILLNYAVFLLIRSTQNFLDANSSMKIDNITLSYTGTEVLLKYRLWGA